MHRNPQHASTHHPPGFYTVKSYVVTPHGGAEWYHKYMEPIQIRSFDKPLDIRLTDQKIVLPSEIQTKVDQHWQGLVKANPRLSRGEIFTVTSVDEDENYIHIKVAETDYAHYLYSRQIGELGEYTVRIIHPAALLITSDNMLIFGAMGAHTGIPGIIQCCGGGLDREAVTSDGAVDVDHTMHAELKEELGIESNDTRVKSLQPTYLKFGGPTGKMTLVYLAKLSVTSKQFMDDYDTFAESLKKAGELPEFDKMFCIQNDAAAVDSFIAEHEGAFNEFMPILLQTVSRS